MKREISKKKIIVDYHNNMGLKVCHKRINPYDNQPQEVLNIKFIKPKKEN